MIEKSYKTKNGVDIYTMQNGALHGFYISLFVRAGAMYESERDNGITHFLEHAAVRNVNSRRGGGLYRTLDVYGLEFNASTYNEMVQFYISGAGKSFGVAASVISEILAPITLTAKEIDTERARIRAEIRESDERTSLASFSNKIVFADTSLSRPITGTPTTVAAITAKRLEEYRRRVFTPKNIFFYVTGAFSEDDISTLAEEIERYSLEAAEPNKNIAPVPQSFFDRDGTVQLKNADFTMARFTFDIDMARVGMQVSDLLYDILLSGYSSDFFIELSENRGLFYDLNGSVERYLNIGTLSFSYELKGSNLCEAVRMTVEILNAMKRFPLPEERLMKVGYVDNAMMLYDDIRELNFTFSYDNHLMNLGYKTIEDRIRAYSDVSAEQIMMAAREIFRVKNLTLTVKGDKKRIDTQQLSDIIRELG